MGARPVPGIPGLPGLAEESRCVQCAVRILSGVCVEGGQQAVGGVSS